MSAMDERPSGGDDARQGRRPSVACRDCGFGWHSARMVEGLRLLGSCPRCNGELEFAGAEPPSALAHEASDAPAPHLVLGLPRPPRR